MKSLYQQLICCEITKKEYYELWATKKGYKSWTDYINYRNHITGRYNPRKKQTIKDRFWSKVDKKGEDECWEWKGGKGRYGMFWLKDRNIQSHIIAYLLSNNVNITSRNVVIMHKCDNKLCCNPKHLILGTQKDNIQDMLNKGRDNYLTGDEWRKARYNR